MVEDNNRKMIKILNVVGARPNFMKIAPIMEAYKSSGKVEPLIVHTGQHYDEQMSKLFFCQLEIPKPDINLGVGSSSHAVQTSKIMRAFEPVVLKYKPDAVLVVGDVNSTIACGLVAVKLGVKLIHVEAGLRSFDRSMPEEINRVLTDSISDFLFCTEQSGVNNLIREGILEEKIFFVGNVMIDTLLKSRVKAQESNILRILDLDNNDFAVLTLHRPVNVDNPVVLSQIFDALEIIQKKIPIVFPVHPRTRKNLSQSTLDKHLKGLPNLILTDPLGYLDFLKLMDSAKLVLTDSGGIQEETTILGVSCLTLRDNTERPVTVTEGTNFVVGTNSDSIIKAALNILKNGCPRKTKHPKYWDGKAAERIVEILIKKL